MTMTRLLYRLLLLFLECVVILLVLALIHVGQLGKTAMITCEATAVRVSMMSAMLCEAVINTISFALICILNYTNTHHRADISQPSSQANQEFPQ